MRKLLAFIMLCLFSLLLKNEKGSCKSNCQLFCRETIKHSSPNTGINADSDKALKQYDGFFFKI